MSATTTLPVVGRTCGHCVQAVTQELTMLDGVQDVAGELTPDGTSVVTVTSAARLDDAAVRAATGGGWYELAHCHRNREAPGPDGPGDDLRVRRRPGREEAQPPGR